MSAEHHATLVRRYFDDVLNGLNGPDPARALAIVDQLFADDFKMGFNNATDAEMAHGRAAHKAFLVDHARDYPDDHWIVEELIAVDDAIACQWHIRARHVESGNPIDVRAADFYRVRDGRLAELRRFLDFQSFNRQKRRSTAIRAHPAR